MKKWKIVSLKLNSDDVTNFFHLCAKSIVKQLGAHVVRI